MTVMVWDDIFQKNPKYYPYPTRVRDIMQQGKVLNRQYEGEL